MYVDLAQNRQTLSFVSLGTVALKSFVAHEDESARERERRVRLYSFLSVRGRTIRTKYKSVYLINAYAELLMVWTSTQNALSACPYYI